MRKTEAHYESFSVFISTLTFITMNTVVSVYQYSSFVQKLPFNSWLMFCYSIEQRIIKRIQELSKFEINHEFLLVITSENF